MERRVRPTAHPPLAPCLQKNVRPRGFGERWATESHIQAANDCPSPHSPCARARVLQQEPPNFSCPPTARSVPTQLHAGSVRKRTGLMRTEAGASGGAWARERRGTSAWLSRRAWPPVRHRVRVLAASQNLRTQGGGQKTDFVRVAALSARDWRCTARAPLSGTDRRLRPLCKKCRQTPILIAPVFPLSSPFSALAAQGPCWGRETRFRWLECRSRERIGAFRPSAKSVGRPLF